MRLAILFRTLLGLAVMMAAALPAAAQEEAPQDPARFLLEKIRVEGPGEAAAHIIRSETLLREGQAYTEDELRQAVARVHRLPFVLAADFSLQKGSRRGAFELVIEAQQARWFFFDHWARLYRLDEPLAINPGDFGTGDDDTLTASLGGLVGVRKFVGRSGVVFAALDSEEAVQVGFTQYNLLGRGIVASAGYSQNVCCATEVLPFGLEPNFVAWDFDDSRKISLNLSIPLGGRQSLQMALSDRAGEAGGRTEVLGGRNFLAPFIRGGDLTYRRAEAKWVYDTSDDPVVPTRGVTLSAGVEAARFEGRNLKLVRFLPGEPFTEEEPLPPFESEQVLAAFSAVHHWSLTPRQTVSATGRLAVGTSRLENLLVDERIVPRADLDSIGGSVGVVHSLTLKRSRGLGNFTDLRLETGAELGVETNSPSLGPSPLERLSLSVGLVFRNQWGRVRALLSYLDLGEVFP